MRTLLPCLLLYLLFLVWERVSLRRSLDRIPLRIAVTGTRGKSSVVSMLAAVFREHGRRVLAKTTGSEALLTLPDGSREQVERTGIPSILEQKHLVQKAGRLKANCLIAEIMSIHPENHFVESRHILQPHVVVLTNVRRDHTEAMGETEDQIASVLSLAVCPRSTVFLPEAENRTSVRAEADRYHATVMPVAVGVAAPLLQNSPDLARREFAGNLDLVFAVANHFGIPEPVIISGIRRAQHDIGGLRIWSLPPGITPSGCYLVNAFAANDPESTFQALAQVTESYPQAAGNIIGILNLRADRAPRTLQWIAALKNGALRRFRRLFVTGGHAAAVRRRLPGAVLLRGGSPEQMMKTVFAEVDEGALILGFGNIKGTGRMLVEHWQRIGIPCS